MALPCGLCCAASRKAGSASLVPRKTPVRLTAQRRCHSSRLAADAARRPRDQRHLAIEPVHPILPFKRGSTRRPEGHEDEPLTAEDAEVSQRTRSNQTILRPLRILSDLCGECFSYRFVPFV